MPNLRISEWSIKNLDVDGDEFTAEVITPEDVITNRVNHGRKLYIKGVMVDFPNKEVPVYYANDVYVVDVDSRKVSLTGTEKRLIETLAGQVLNQENE